MAGTEDYLKPGLWTDAQEIGDGWDVPFVVLGGAIKYWWGDMWDTPEHRAYVQWRNDLTQWFIDQKWLVYLPHQAMKGTWNPKAQAANNAAIAASDLFVVASEWWIPSEGTDKEIEFCRQNGVDWIRSPESLGFERATRAIESELAFLRR